MSLDVRPMLLLRSCRGGGVLLGCSLMVLSLLLPYCSLDGSMVLALVAAVNYE